MESLDQFRIYLTRVEPIAGWSAWSLIPFVLAILAVAGAVAYFVYTHLFAPDDTPDRRDTAREASLFLQCLRLIREDPVTLVFSAVAAVLSLLPPILTVVMMHSERGMERLGGIAFWFGARNGALVSDLEKLKGLEAIFCTYLFCYVVGGLTSLGVLGCSLVRLRGGEPRLSDGMGAMSENAGAIMEYALIGAVARTGMTMLAPARWLSRFSLETVWTATQLYVLPVMIVERLGAVDAIRRSNEIALSSPAQDAWLLIGDELASQIPYFAGTFTLIAMLFLSTAGYLVPTSSITVGLLAELTVLPACLVAASTGMVTATVYLVFLGGAYLRAVGQPGRCYEFFPLFTRSPEPV
ncbi:MAG: DUF6159 family protein [Elusimicrobiota bacterium]